MISLDTQRLITNKTDINQLDAWLLSVHEINYLKYGSIVNEGSLILRYRVISLSKLIYNKINDIELVKKTKIPLKKYNKLGIEQIHITNELYPNWIDLSYYGILMTNDYHDNNNDYQLYQYKSGIQILVKDILNDNILRIVLKNKHKVLYYKDIFNNKNNSFIRHIGNNMLTFNLDGIFT